MKPEKSCTGHSEVMCKVWGVVMNRGGGSKAREVFLKGQISFSSIPVFQTTDRTPYILRLVHDLLLILRPDQLGCTTEFFDVCIFAVSLRQVLFAFVLICASH